MVDKAEWIWVKDTCYDKDWHAFFIQKISLNSSIKYMDIAISASDHYKLYGNNSFIGEGPAPAALQFYYYDTYRLGKKELDEIVTVREKEKYFEVNFIIHAYSFGKSEMVTCQNQGIPAVIFSFELYYEDGNKEIFISDQHCKSQTPPAYFHDYIEYDEARISQWGGFKEVYLSEFEWDFKAIKETDEAWQESKIVSEGKDLFAHLRPRDIPFLQRQNICGQAILQTEAYLGSIVDAAFCLNQDNSFATIDASFPQSYPSIVIDFGTLVVGYPFFIVKGNKKTSMRVLYGESLDMMLMDTLIMNGNKQTYRPYQRRAFRYMKLTFHNAMEPIQFFEVGVESVRYPFEKKSCFHCSDAMLNQIYDTSLFTVMQNSQDHFEDCVVREKMQWLADSRIMALVSYWNFNDARLAGKAIRQFFDIQRSDGLIPSAGPQAMENPNFDFCMHFVVMVYEYYFYTGDISFLQENFIKLKQIMGFLISLEDENGLLDLAKKPDLNVFLDWGVVDKREKNTMINCLYVEVLLCFSKVVKALDYETDYDYFHKANMLKTAIVQELYCPEKGLFYDCCGSFGKSSSFSEQTNMMAVFHKVLDAQGCKKLLEKILHDSTIEKIKGAFLLAFSVPALYENSMPQKAKNVFYKFWGGMIERGAKTWWEVFDPQTPKTDSPDLFSTNSVTSYISYIPCSHSHGWGASPAFLLPRFILGIEPLDVGFSKIRFQPYTEGLQYASGSISTPRGEIKVQWQKNHLQQLEYILELPKEIICVTKP